MELQTEENEDTLEIQEILSEWMFSSPENVHTLQTAVN